MIKKLKALLAGLALVAVSATASAATWSQTIDLNPDLKLNTGDSFSWTHDLKTDGFQPFQDLITDFSLSIHLYDDGDRTFEYAKLDLPGFADDKSSFEVDSTWYTTGGDALLGYLQLNVFGELSVTLTSLLGDFYLDKSVLNASGRSVPEPGALALVGLGLAGLAFARRRQQKQ